MADIFISYSSRDRESADQLAELLTSAGFTIWIDREGLDVSTVWSGEIVDAIDECTAVVVLLSPNSVQSRNVVREVALAFEKNKKILPLDLEAVPLPRDLQYHLAGIQRSSMTNIDSIIRALGKLGLQATSAPMLKLVKQSDSRKSLMILPFEDLSPTADNQWFADGIVSEMISSLSNVKSLRVTDAQTTKEFKNYKGHLTVYAKEMGIRYFVEGDVRKFGDNIKIASRLLDIETGDHLWQDSLKGTMQDIFDIQETVAKRVLAGLNATLTNDEEKRIKKKLTENAEAYEMYLKARDYFDRHTRADYERALGLDQEAARLDPMFVQAHICIASTALGLYRQYSREKQWLDHARKHIARAEEIVDKSARIHSIRSQLAYILGEYEEALRLALRAIELDPGYVAAYDNLAFAYQALGNREKTVWALEREVRFVNGFRAYGNYLMALHQLGDPKRLGEAARKALPLIERHLRLTPDDVSARVDYAWFLRWAGEHEASLSEARTLEATESLHGVALYNLACLYLDQGESERSLSVLRKSVEKGFRNIEEFQRDPDLSPIRETPAFEALMKDLEAKIEEEKNS